MSGSPKASAHRESNRFFPHFEGRMWTFMRTENLGGPSGSRSRDLAVALTLGHLQSPIRITQLGPPPFSGTHSQPQNSSK